MILYVGDDANSKYFPSIVQRSHTYEGVILVNGSASDEPIFDGQPWKLIFQTVICCFKEGYRGDWLYSY